MKRYAALFSVLLASVARAETVNLDNFIGGLENDCVLSVPLSKFRDEIDARYSYEEGMRRLQAKVVLPRGIEVAIGSAKAIKRNGYTNVEIPLHGIYRGLPTRSISFDLGHSNGVNATTLTFDAPAQDVVRIIGPEVARTMQKFGSDPEIAAFGFSAKIVPKGKSSALVCDTST